MNGSLRTIGVWLGLVWLGAAGCSGGGGGDAQPQRVEPAEIEVTSDRSLIFTEAGQTAVVSAVVVDASGNTVNAARVTWSSSDPDAVEVDEQGNVTAVTSLGSAVLTAEYQGLRNLVTAVVVVLRPETTLVRTDDVISVNADRTEIELALSSAHEALAAGDVVVNGSANGFLSRIASVETRPGSVLLRVSDAAIVDAVKEMDLRVESPVDEFEDNFDSIEGNDGGAAGAPKAVLPAPKCEVMLTRVNVGLEGIDVTPKYALRDEIVIRVENGTLQRLQIAFVGEVELEVTIAAFKLASGYKGKITCDVKLTPRAFARVPIFGGLAIGAVATPTFGFELEAQYAAEELSINGLSFKYAERIKAGLQFDAVEGYSPIQHRETTIREGKPTKLERAQEDTVTFKAEPFLGLIFGVSFVVGTESAGSVDIIGSKLFGGYEVAISNPLSIEEPSYTGPRWNVYTGINADVNPFLMNIKLVEKGLGLLGLEDVSQFVGIDVKLFEDKTPLLESPDPTITPSPKVLTADSTTQLAIRAPGADVNTEAEAWAFPVGGGEGQLIGSDLLDGQGSADVEWTPSVMDEGKHELKALLYDDIFGDIGLPYATRAQPKPDRTVEVGLGQIAVSPSSADLNGRVGVPSPGAFLIFNLTDEAVAFETSVSGAPLWVTITQNATGTVPAEEEIKVDFEAECPEPEGTFETVISFDFQDAGGNPIGGDDVPSSFLVTLTCTDECAVANLPSLSVSGSLDFGWSALGMLDGGLGNRTKATANHSASLSLISHPVYPRGVPSVSGEAHMTHEVENLDTGDKWIWDGTGAALGPGGGDIPGVGIFVDALNCTYDVWIEVTVYGTITQPLVPPQEGPLRVVEAWVFDRPIPSDLNFAGTAPLPMFFPGIEGDWFDPGTPSALLRNYYEGDPPTGLLTWSFMPSN